MQNLLKEGLGTVVEKTSLTRKLTIDGVTKAYPVYRVRLDQLFYNDQNDRIATWISQYKSENGADSFSELDRASYNAIIEQFIIQSNEAAIEKTQMNIQLVHQREPGVILADGRVIDGNRRFTCLRRLALNDEEFNWFETVILDTDIENGKKQIKMLELAIQHGEEKKVDYNPIDRLVGVYQDIVETELLTVEEYAYSTNETIFEVKKRIESAMLLVEFLEYIHMPKQYHIARDYQVVSVIADLQPLLRKCSTPEMQEKVKNAVFANIMMRTIGDSRKYIRNLSQMMDTGFFTAYIKDQERIGEVLKEDLDEAAPEGKRDLDFFVSTHEEAAENLQMSLDRSLLKAKKHETRNKPSQIVSKSITLLKDVVLPSNIEIIGRNAFSGIGLGVLQLPKSVKKVERSAFDGASELIVYDTIDPDAVEANEWKHDRWNGSVDSPLACAMLGVPQSYVECQGNTRWRGYHITVLSANSGDVRYRIFCDSEERDDYRAMMFSAWGKNASFTFDAYDDYFMKTRNMLGRAEMAFCRIQYPEGLSTGHRANYEAYLERCMYIERSAKRTAEIIGNEDAVERLAILDRYKAIDDHNIGWIKEIMKSKKAKKCQAYLDEHYSM